ncbi:MAG: hypothetical protein Q7R95_06485, partial [bacterium]|nr:hypothetical protein [bacterium]
SLALFSFFYSDFKIKDSLKTINLMEQVDSAKQDIFLYKNADPEMIGGMEIFNAEIEVEKNIFLKAKNENGYYIINAEYKVEKGFLLWKKTVVIASAEYIVKDISN